eukprot:jgi/Ulvmu1/777/UM010_0151.1
MASLACCSAARGVRSVASVRPTRGGGSHPAPVAQPQLAQLGHVETQRRSTATHAASQAVSPETATISEEELIELTKKFVAAGIGGTDERNLSDDMIFRGPVVGPLTKDQYVAALSSFQVEEAFPDIQTNAFGYSIDPQDPYRVWFFTQTTGTHTGNFSFAGNTIPPTGGKIQNGTEANSIIWTPDRKVKYISVGYCVDRINSNTPNGTMKVAVVGFLRATGKAELWDFISNPIVQWGLNAVNKLQGKPSNTVPFDDLPDWWKKIPDADLRDGENYSK